MQDLLFTAPVSDCYPETRAKLIIYPAAEEFMVWIDTDTKDHCNIDRTEFLSLLNLARRMGFLQRRESDEF